MPFASCITKMTNTASSYSQHYTPYLLLRSCFVLSLRMQTEAHHRHYRPNAETSSLLPKAQHLSFQDEEDEDESSQMIGRWCARPARFVSALAAIITLFLSAFLLLRSQPHESKTLIIPIEHATEHYLDIGDGGLTIWFRTWGNKQDGIPVLFVHGGPGNAIADYNNGNKRFFSENNFFVVEADQRGTGKSQPSVRQDWRNMKHYSNISIDVIAHDYELVRESLGIDQWLVWGGSFGSTISLNYGMRYPERCLALILRGIYLDTPAEMNAVYSRSAYEQNKPKRLAEFDILFKVAAENVRQDIIPLDKYDSKSLLGVYERMIQQGDRNAIWHWHVFENNLMEEDPANLLDPDVIQDEFFPEAQSVAFFETRLWMHGAFESPSNLLQRVDSLTTSANLVPTWICQGRQDEVCPAKYAYRLVNALNQVRAPLTARFLDAGHEDTDPVMADCLQTSMLEFQRYYLTAT
jgi:proline iminopeptidase